MFWTWTEDLVDAEETSDMIPYEEVDPSAYDSDVMETDNIIDNDEYQEETINANLGGGWGRIVFPPVRRGRQVHMNICRSTNPDASEGSFDHEVITQTKNPTLHRQARKSFWGDLWPSRRTVTTAASWSHQCKRHNIFINIETFWVNNLCMWPTSTDKFQAWLMHQTRLLQGYAGREVSEKVFLA